MTEQTVTEKTVAERAAAPPNDLTIAAGYEETLVANGLDSLDALFEVAHGESLGKPDLSPWRERLRLTWEVSGERRTFYLKRFRDAPRAARREVRRSGTGAASVAGLEWTWMQRLAADGIPCALPVAFGEQLRGSREVRSAILTAAVPGCSLEHWAARWGETDRARVRRLVRPLARLVSRLHQCGYVHRDLYLSHIFHDPEAPLEQSLHLIDLQRVFRPLWAGRRWIVKDLAALDYSVPGSLVYRTDRLRWLTYYLGTPKLDASARRLVYRIVGKTQSIARHDRHRTARWGHRSENP